MPLAWDLFISDIVAEVIGTTMIGIIVYLIFRRHEQQKERLFRKRLVEKIRRDVRACFWLFIRGMATSCSVESLERLGDAGNEVAKTLVRYRVDVPPGYGFEIDKLEFEALPRKFSLLINDVKQIQELFTQHVINEEFFDYVGSVLDQLQHGLSQIYVLGITYIPADVMSGITDLLDAMLFFRRSRRLFPFESLYMPTHMVMMRLIDVLRLLQ